jgi:hypothetical protein
LIYSDNWRHPERKHILDAKAARYAPTSSMIEISPSFNYPSIPCRRSVTHRCALLCIVTRHICIALHVLQPYRNLQYQKNYNDLGTSGTETTLHAMRCRVPENFFLSLSGRQGISRSSREEWRSQLSSELAHAVLHRKPASALLSVQSR